MTTPTSNPTPQELTGHVSPETAYLVPDYPYGFRLRTEIRYWIETKPGHGQRVMSQTRNPKRAGQPWNTPKGSTYAPIKVLYVHPTTGHVEHASLGGYATEAEIDAFRTAYPATCAEARNARSLDVLIAHQRAQQRVTWSVTPAADAPRQSPAEQVALIRRLTLLELRKLRGEEILS
jgi:hypothetical protein